MSALLAESSRAHNVLSLLSFYEYSDPLWDFVLLLPQMENEMDALLAILLLKPLLEYSWVFNNPVKVPSVGFSSNFQNSKSSFFCCACLHTLSTPSWRSLFLPQNVQQFCSPLSGASMRLLECPAGRALRISMIRLPSSTLSRVLLNCTLCLCSMPTWKSSQNL
jgi:hypothetical protein